MVQAIIVISNTLISNWLIVVPITIIIDINSNYDCMWATIVALQAD